MFDSDPPQEQKSAVAYEQQLRPDQKRCRRCRCALLLEQQRCPFCGNAPWLWHPNSRFLIVTVVIAVFILLLLPLMSPRDKPYRVPVSDSP